MLRYMLLLLLLPSVVKAQYNEPVYPVESNDYLDLIKKDSADRQDSVAGSSVYSMRRANLLVKNGIYRDMRIQNIAIHGNELTINPHETSTLGLGGYYNSAIEFKTINRMPALQRSYVQGSSQNGAQQWQGPETGELFSYGPHINLLEFDGSAYPYDVRGRLVPIGTGNGSPAKAYDNTIFRTGVLFSQSLNIHANHYRNGKPDWTTAIRLGQSSERMFIKQNKNVSKNISASFRAWLKPVNITGTYSYLQDKFSNSNRNGFLNRVYQNAILTPVSFQNSQGSLSGNGQRSYSNLADNPLFLLEDNGNDAVQSRHNGSLILEKKLSKFYFKLIQSVDHAQENSIEGYKPGTAYFQNGIVTDRKKKDVVYFLKASPSFETRYGGYRFESRISANYIFTNARSGIDYTINPIHYSYQRSSHDIGFNYNLIYTKDDIRAGAELGNKVYISNTAVKDRFFLPLAAGYVLFDNVLTDFSVRISSSFTRFDNELPIDKSMAHANLLRYSTEQAFTYFPVKEARSFKGLIPINHREWSARVELDYEYKVGLTAEVFIKKTENDVFPVYESGDLYLRNIADHRNKGIELQLTQNRGLFRNKFRTTNTITFTAWQNKVTRVEDGYDFTPIAGFSNVHKAIVKGQPFGAIVGNSYRRDGAGNIVIGSDGFPLADNRLKVIGNPIPDFVLKLNNGFFWKMLSMSIDWEWRKGGEAWNGTEAALDFYGRSEQTASLRNTTNYVFAGVLEDGHFNTIPVSFYDPSLPVTANRWTRYGLSGIAEEYIQKADQVRIQALTLSCKLNFKKYIQTLTLSTYINNLVLWSAYKGADPGIRLLYDQPNTSGLDFFNLPATKTYGFSASIQF